MGAVGGWCGSSTRWIRESDFGSRGSGGHGGCAGGAGVEARGLLWLIVEVARTL